MLMIYGQLRIINTKLIVEVQRTKCPPLAEEIRNKNALKKKKKNAFREEVSVLPESKPKEKCKEHDPLRDHMVFNVVLREG